MQCLTTMLTFYPKRTSPNKYDYTKLFGLWKQKVSKLEQNVMRCIHGKERDAKLLELLVLERIKSDIILNSGQL